jgi:regulator of nonsense transcripts 2
MENEVRGLLAKVLPAANLLQTTSQTDNTNLGTIREDNEESTAANQNCDEFDDDDDTRTERASRKDQDDDQDQSGTEVEDNSEPLNESSNQSDENENVVVVQARAKIQIEKEDEEFIKEFESLVTENIAQRTKETFKMPAIDISIPMVKKSTIQPGPTSVAPSSLFSLATKKQSEEQNDQNNASQNQKKFNFIVMMKKGNKPHYHNMEVPLNSEFASQFKAKEEAERAEKEKLKQLTLNINSRIEQEEYQELMQQHAPIRFSNSSSSSMQASFITNSSGGGAVGQGFVPNLTSYSSNTNRDRNQKYMHPKGAPDADLIFGPSSNK